MGIHLLRYVHGNKLIRIDDAIHDIFVTIAQHVGLHMWWKQLHVFPSTTFNSSHQQIDIVLTRDGIHILTDVVITNPMCVDIFSRFCTTYRFATSNATQAKERNYYD
jgi:hypothetical protein